MFVHCKVFPTVVLYNYEQLKLSYCFFKVELEIMFYPIRSSIT